MLTHGILWSRDAEHQWGVKRTKRCDGGDDWKDLTGKHLLLQTRATSRRWFPIYGAPRGRCSPPCAQTLLKLVITSPPAWPQEGYHQRPDQGYTPSPWTDTNVWKSYLPHTSDAGGKKDGHLKWYHRLHVTCPLPLDPLLSSRITILNTVLGINFLHNGLFSVRKLNKRTVQINCDS